ncbi:hypothetical protein QBC46DRAFT_413179 [Diplogelasinospora grovesii]|uniref:Uncharacterized protein n=1 Tax=Diplogelasinospora grovesii TaxID=303347 RepID=A0AAN6S0H8_9PEZI|nr:hypothetical protein QBC46DRAFT_413179 [Diplogelasinospora grovesii]
MATTQHLSSWLRLVLNPETDNVDGTESNGSDHSGDDENVATKECVFCFRVRPLEEFVSKRKSKNLNPPTTTTCLECREFKQTRNRRNVPQRHCMSIGNAAVDFENYGLSEATGAACSIYENDRRIRGTMSGDTDCFTGLFAGKCCLCTKQTEMRISGYGGQALMDAICGNSEQGFMVSADLSESYNHTSPRPSPLVIRVVLYFANYAMDAVRFIVEKYNASIQGTATAYSLNGRCHCHNFNHNDVSGLPNWL